MTLQSCYRISFFVAIIYLASIQYRSRCAKEPDNDKRQWIPKLSRLRQSSSCIKIPWLTLIQVSPVQHNVHIAKYPIRTPFDTFSHSVQNIITLLAKLAYTWYLKRTPGPPQEASNDMHASFPSNIYRTRCTQYPCIRCAHNSTKGSI